MTKLTLLSEREQDMMKVKTDKIINTSTIRMIIVTCIIHMYSTCSY